jgi:hypothetical protein
VDLTFVRPSRKVVIVIVVEGRTDREKILFLILGGSGVSIVECQESCETGSNNNPYTNYRKDSP